jgi:uncharacterized protein (TIGR02266 family)
VTSSEQPAESRSHQRLPFEVEVDVVSEHNFFAGLTLNISDGGIFVSTHVHHKIGTRLEIRLMLPGDTEPTTIMTEVRWVRDADEKIEGGAGLGLRFVDIEPATAAKIQAFTARRDPLYYEDD